MKETSHSNLRETVIKYLKRHTKRGYTDAFSIAANLGEDAHAVALTIADIEKEWLLKTKIIKLPVGERKAYGTNIYYTVNGPVTRYRWTNQCITDLHARGDYDYNNHHQLNRQIWIGIHKGK